MRPNQQNNKNRSRGRNNNGGRKHLNPLSRNYESNGPDVKVRGNAAHVAEKYLQLARDAQSSGDSVMAENYLQHAEHYFRIVSAAQQQSQPRTDQPGAPQSEAEDDDDDFPPINDRFSSPEPVRLQQPNQPQSPEYQPPNEGGESGGEPSAEAAASTGDGESQAAGAEGDGSRRHRDRRARRRGRGTGGEQGGAGNDPAASPQPEVGELPAFLTAGNTPAE
jgi:Domain of unknown function (DUF4167)